MSTIPNHPCDGGRRCRHAWGRFRWPRRRAGQRQERRARARRLRRRRRLARRLRHPEARRLQRHHRAEPDHLARRRRGRDQERHRRPGRPGRPRRPLLRRRGDQRGRHRSEGRAPRLHRRLRARCRRVGADADRQPAPGRPGAADPAAAGRLPLPRPHQVRRLLRRRRQAGGSRLHGRLAGALGRGRPRRRRHRPGLEAQAELVSRRHRRPHDPARRPAPDGEPGRRDRRRDPRQPRDLCVQSDRAGGVRRVCGRARRSGGRRWRW